jgi:hypothetical protein
MAAEVKSQAIFGVAAGQESQLETVYPSIAASGIGRLIGSVCDSIPLRIGGVKLSYLLFGLPMAPFALIGYFVLKATGEKYSVTNRSVLASSALGSRLLRKVSLTDVADVAVEVLPGQSFYHAGDVHLLSAKGEPLLTLAGVGRPERFRRVILDARDARLENDSALKVIQARASA